MYLFKICSIFIQLKSKTVSLMIKFNVCSYVLLRQDIAAGYNAVWEPMGSVRKRQAVWFSDGCIDLNLFLSLQWNNTMGFWWINTHFETSIETFIFVHGWKLWYHVEVLATSSAMEPLSYGCVYPFCFFLSMCTRMHVHVWDTIHIPANGYTLLVPLIYRWQYNV